VATSPEISPASAAGETQLFAPSPGQRAHLVQAYDARAGDQSAGTPERWFEANGAGDRQVQPETGRPGRCAVGPGLILVVLITSVVGAALGAGGTVAAMRAAGAFDNPTTAAATGPQVVIESDASTVIAAVAKIGPTVVQIVANDGAGGTAVGSGTIYDPRGWILTNAHIVRGAKTITVRLSDNRRLAGTTYGLDTLTDLAVVKIDGIPDLAMATLGDSSSVQVGELVIAIGSPLGLAYPNSASRGIVSALGRDIDVPADGVNPDMSLHSLIQTDAAINPGNSGGPLIDASGKVIGIATAAAQSTTGVGFAIPIDVAKPIMQQALAGEKIARPYIGISYDMIDQALKDENNLALSEGAWVHAVNSAGNEAGAVATGSPADAAGVKTGDIITKFEGQAIDSTHRLEDLLVKYAPGRTVAIELYRSGNYITVNVTLGTRPAA